MASQLEYSQSLGVLQNIFKECGVENATLNVGGAYIREEDDKIATYQEAIYLVLPLNDEDYHRVDHAIDKEWLNVASPLRNTTIQISSKSENVSAWPAPTSSVA